MGDGERRSENQKRDGELASLFFFFLKNFYFIICVYEGFACVPHVYLLPAEGSKEH